MSKQRGISVGTWLAPTWVAVVIFISASTLRPAGGWAQQREFSSLPPESELPDSFIEQSSANALPSEAELADQESNVANQQAVPGEEVIPEVPDSTDANDSEEEDRTSAALPGEIQPLLRLDFQGHTAAIRTLDLSDGGRMLVSGGDDKDLHVWRRAELGARGWLHLRTVRWPITRGPRGIVAAARLRGDLAAFAGYGAFGTLGEIRVVNIATGELAFDPLVDGHRQVVGGLDWAPGDTPRLASIDMAGQVMVWQPDPQTGLWAGETLVATDAARLDAETARAVRRFRAFVPITFAGADHVIVPHYAGMVDGVASWQLARIDVRDGSQTLLNDVLHREFVLDCDATADGNTVVSSDRKSITVWSRRGDSEAVKQIPTRSALSLDVDPAGERLLVGTQRLTDGAALLQLWDLRPDQPKLLSQRRLADHVRAVAWDHARGEAVAAGGDGIEIQATDESGVFRQDSIRRLVAPVRPIARVAFSKQEDGYMIALATGLDDAGMPRWEHRFDLSGSRLLGRGPIDSDAYLPPQRTATRWGVAGPVSTPDGQRARLVEAGEPRGVLPFRVEEHGFPTDLCTLPAERKGTEEPGEKPPTGAVIVGTNGRNDIYAFAADDSNPPRMLRHFRGHAGAILSLGTSADRKYLVSSSSDSTVCIWNLQGLLDAAGPTINLWGVDFQAEGNRLIAAEVREDGPLYFRGVRGGDRLVSIRYVDAAGSVQAESDAEKMFDYLATAPFDEMVVFQFSRLDRARPGFQSYPAWRPLARLFVDQTREWAYWTPAGYYDASFNGHQRFGWQVNRGIRDTPDYFRAAQFRKVLERPDVMRRLLSQGSLPAAMRAAPEGDDAIVNQYRNQPKIEVIEPKGGATIRGDALTVRARIDAPLGANLVEPRAYVSGVPAVSMRRLQPQATGELFEWQFRLPRDRHLQLEVVAATEAEAVERSVIHLEHQSDAPLVKPRMHVLAIGASRYPDPQIPSLDFAAGAAEEITELFSRRASPLYRVTADRLVDRDATRSLWKVFAQQAAEQLAERVSPDDLVVMYLCGHGLRDRRTNEWYFVTADARFHDLQNDEYAQCLSFEDLAALSKLPCRKLAILDSCHSGAVQPVMRHDDLKSALRFLQDDVVLTITASEGDEEAAERRESRLGRFTARLAEALSGAADDSSDGVVTLQEAIGYVRRTVSEESRREGMPQHPTASPEYLLQTIELPLTAVRGRDRQVHKRDGRDQKDVRDGG